MIETDRLILRLMTESDFDDVFKIFTDEKVMQTFECDPFNPQQMRTWIKRNSAHQEKYGYGLFSVILKAENKLIGDCGLEHEQFNNKPCVEIGYDFLSEYWNQGYATEAASAVKDYAVHRVDIDLNSVCSYIRRQNQASIRVSEKIGMEKLLEYENHGIEYYLYGYSRAYFQ